MIPTAQVMVGPVTTRADEQDFVKLPAALWRQASRYVAPLACESCDLLAGRHPFYGSRHAPDARAAFFLARDPRTGQALGRIAAIANDAFVRARVATGTTDAPGFFGYFDCVNDPCVAALLLDTARAWLAERGFTQMVGPASPSQNGEWGLLVEGTDQPHRFLLPLHPPYYAGLLAECGLRPLRDYWAFHLQLRDDPAATNLARQHLALERALHNRLPDVVVRPLNLRRFDSDLAGLLGLMETSLADHFLRTPMNGGEMRRLGQLLRAVIVPGLVLLAERRGTGELVGGVVVLPDVNETLGRMRARRGALEPLEMALRLRVRRPTTVRVLLLGATGWGVSSTLLCRLYENLCRAGIKSVDVHWVDAENQPMMNFLRRHGAKPDRRLRIYQSDTCPRHPAT